MIAVLAGWFAVAVVLPASEAKDAAPFVVAGEFVRSDPSQVYVEDEGDTFELKPAFKDRVCEVGEAHDNCEDFAVPFLSPPTALPLLAAISALGPGLAISLIRVLGVAAFAVGIVAIWRRLAGSSPRAPLMLAASVVLMTPLVMISVRLGQTTPFMFASVALGVVVADRTAGGRIAAAGVWALTVAFKAASAVLGLVLLAQRRWRLLGVTVAMLAGLTVAGVVMGGKGVVGDFVSSSQVVSLNATVTPYNGSIEAALYYLPLVSVSESAAEVAGMAIRVVVLLTAVLMLRRLRDHDVQWAFAWVVLVVVTPLVWWHYAVVFVAAVAIAISRAAEPARWLPFLPAVVIAGVPLSLPVGWGIPTAQWLFGVACMGLVWWIGSKGQRHPVSGSSGDSAQQAGVS